MVYHMILNISIVPYAININQFESANPNSQSFPPPAPHTPLGNHKSVVYVCESVSVS